jgi:hypothetical protein
MRSINEGAAGGRSRAVALVGIGALAGLVLVGCGATKTVTATVAGPVQTVTNTVTAPARTVTAPARTVTVKSNTTPISASACAVYVNGANARLSVSGNNASSECTSIVQANPGGDGWTSMAHAAKNGFSEPMSSVCNLKSPSGTLTVVVSDSGLQVFGTDACNYLTDAGWTTI